jgi:uncharacterized protein YkwD
MTESEIGRRRSTTVAAGLLLLAGLLAPVDTRAAPQGTIQDGIFSPGRPAAAAFGPDPGSKCGGSVFSRLPREVERQSKAAGATPAQPDGTLCAMAEVFLGWSDPNTPREGVLAFVSGYMGLPAPVRQVFVTVIDTDDDVVISERLAETIARHGKTGPNARYGVATSLLPREDRLSKARNRVVLVLGEEPVRLDPLPRRLPLGGQAALRGQLQVDLENPKVIVSDSKGKVTDPPQVAGKVFQAELRCGDKPGTIRVQVSAEQAGDRRVVASFPVACGTELPTTVAVQSATWPVEVPAQEKKVLELVNADRTGAGLPPVVWDDAVAGVARSLSEALSDPARRAGAGAAVVEQLQKAGVASSLLLVNPAQGRTAEDAQERLLTSPGHRANLMDPDVNHGGVGITTVTEKNGSSVTYLAEVFVKFLPPVDLPAVQKGIVAAIAERRAQAKVAAIPVDPALQDVAQRYALEMAAAKGALPEERDTQMLDSLKKTYKSVHMLAGASPEPLQFTKENKVLANGKALGVGLAQGDHPKLGRNAFFVVILIGELQDPAKGKQPAKPKATKPPAATPAPAK